MHGPNHHLVFFAQDVAHPLLKEEMNRRTLSFSSKVLMESLFSVPNEGARPDCISDVAA